MPRGVYEGNKGRIAWNRGLAENPAVTARRAEALKVWWSDPGNRELQSQAHKGQKPYNTGTKGVHLVGEANPKWKGDQVGYHSLHNWVSRYLGKASKCVKCGLKELPKGMKRYFQWSNISREYKRELSDWQELCVKCHRVYDMKVRVVGR